MSPVTPTTIVVMRSHRRLGSPNLKRRAPDAGVRVEGRRGGDGAGRTAIATQSVYGEKIVHVSGLSSAYELSYRPTVSIPLSSGNAGDMAVNTRRVNRQRL